MVLNSNAWIGRLGDSLSSGTVLDMAPGISDADVIPRESQSWHGRRRLPADKIRELLLAPGVSADPRGLQIRGALITGTLDLSFATLVCRLSFDRCAFEQELKFMHSVLPGLDLTGCVLPGIQISGATVVGELDLSFVESSGEIRALGIHVGSQLSLKNAVLGNSHVVGTALTLDRAHVASGLFLNHLRAQGEVRALGIRVVGQLSLRDAVLSNAKGDALSLHRAMIEGDVLMDGMTAIGKVSAPGLYVAGQLSLRRATLSNTVGDALNLDNAKIDAGAFMDHLTATGKVRAAGLQVGGWLSTKSAKLSNPGGEALVLQGATLGTFILEFSSVVGGINLAYTSIQVLVVEDMKPPSGLPSLSSAQGWRLGAVQGFLRKDRQGGFEWLSTIDGQLSSDKREFIAQPWHELAKVYDQIGQPEDGRRLRYEAAKKTTRVVPWQSKWVRWTYHALVGYGYYPATVIVWIAVLWFTVFTTSSLNPSAFTPTSPNAETVLVTDAEGRTEKLTVTGATPVKEGYASFHPGLFAMDIALPATSTGQSSAWRISGSTWMAILFAVIKGFSWALTALLLAGVTGLLRKV